MRARVTACTDDVVRVDMLQSEGELRSIHDHPPLRQPPLRLEQLEHVAAALSTQRNHAASASEGCAGSSGAPGGRRGLLGGAAFWAVLWPRVR